MDNNENLREGNKRGGFVKVLVSVLVAALAAFVMIPLTSTMTKQEVFADTSVEGDANGVDVEITASKTLGGGGTLTDQQFEFTLEAVDGAPMPAKSTAKNDANGNISFGTAHYNSAGTYKYVIKEVNDNQANIEYDETGTTAGYSLEVTVTGPENSGSTDTNTEDPNFPTSFTHVNSDWGEDAKVRLNGPVVKDSEGNAVSGAQVTLVRNASGAEIYKWKSDEGGLTLDLKSGETYTLKAAKNGYTINDVTFDVPAQQGGSATPNNGDGYLPKKHATGQTNAAIEVTYNQGGDIELGWYSPKSVTFADGTKENVFCGAYYKNASEKDNPKRTIWNADLSAWQSPSGVNWQAGIIKPSEATWNRWLDRVAYLHSKEYRDADYANANGAWNQAGDPSVMTGWDLRDAVQKVMYNGYPYNAAGFTNTGALRKTTQEALFFVIKNGLGYKQGQLDITEGDFRDYAPDKDMFDALVNYALKGTNSGNMQNYPADTETYVYWTANDTSAYTLNAQPLIGMYASYDTTVPVTANLVANTASGEEETEIEITNVEAGTFTCGNTYEVKSNPEITNTTAKLEGNEATDEAAASYELAAGDTAGVKLSDTIEFTGLDASKTYTVRATAYDASGEQVRQKTDTVKGKTEGSTTIEFNRAVNEGTYKIKAELFEGNKAEGTPVAEHNGDLSKTSETATVTRANPAEATLNIQLEKSIEGLEGDYPSYHFTLTGDDDASKATVVNGSRWTNAKSHKLNNPFNLKFTEAGTYTYTVAEDKDAATYKDIDLKGAKLDAADQTVTVKVELVDNALQVTEVNTATLNGGTATLDGKFDNTYFNPEITNTTAKIGDGAGKATATADAPAEYTLKENETTVKLSDVVTFTGLDASQTYKVRATSYDANGTQVHQKGVDVTGKTEGSITVEFNKPIGSGTYNIKAELLLNGSVVATHNGELGETSERAVVKKAPKITNTTANAGGVEASDDDAAEYTLAEGETDTTLKDTVEFADLDKTKTYTIKATVCDAEGNEVESKTAEVKDQTAGSIDVEFANVGEGTYNIKAELICDGETVATHNGRFEDTSERAVVKKTPEKVSIKVDKKWVAADGTTEVSAPANASVRVQVLADGKLAVVDGVKQQATITAKNKWTYEFKNLPKQNAEGKDIVYTLKEESFSAEGFVRDGITGDVENGFVLSNKKEPNGDIKTNASDAEGNDTDKELDPKADAKIKDVVTFENLKVGKTYTLSGELHKKTADGKDGGTIAYKSCELSEGENATVDGMTFTPTEANGSVVMTFTVDASKLAGKKIVVFETAESEGGDAIVHAKIDDEDQTVEVDNPEVKLTVTKKWTVAEGSQTKVPDNASVTFQVLADGTEVDGQSKTVTAAESWKHTFTDLPKFNDNGDEIVYTIEETAFTGEGFEAGSVEQDGDNAYAFVAENTEKVPGEITVKLQLEKAIPGRDGNIPTFKFTLEGVAQDGAEIVNGTRWTNRTSHKLNNPFVVKFTKEGEYTFTVKEDKTLTGDEYAGVNFTAEDQTVTFNVEKDGDDLKVASVEGATGSALNWTMKNKFENTEKDYEVKINKTDMGGTEIDGAEIKVTGPNNFEKTWTSKAGETMELTVKPGQYTLVETSEPEGYIKVTTEIKFTVAENGTVTVNTTKVAPAGAIEKDKDGTIILKDKLEEYDVSINKTDMGGKEIDGAEIKVTDSEGETVKEWTSKTGETMDLKLEPGTYKLTEVNAPEGYQCVTTEIEFEVAMDGKVTVKTTEVDPAGAVEKAEDGTIILKDEYKDHDVKINKTDLGGEELEGAVITVTGPNDFSKTWESKKNETMDLTVKPGTYTMVENAAPEGYQKVTTKIVFEVAVDGTVTVKTKKVNPAGAVEKADDGTIILKDKAKDIEIKTNATDAADGDHIVKPVKKVTIVDEVSYTNLLVGKEYTISGTLHIKNADGTDGGELKVGGKAVTATKTFTATKANGSEKLEFTFDASALDGQTVVAFEKCSEGDKVVATHEDITDEAQTVEVKGEKVKVSVAKTWSGEAAEEIEVKLTRNGKDFKKVKLNADNKWKAEWTGLAKEDVNGKAYTYAVTEVVPEGYTQTKYTTKTDVNGNVTVAFENTKDYVDNGKVKVEVSKTWSGDAAESLDVQLTRNGEAVEGQDKTLNAENEWKAEWTELDKADADGNAYTYAVTETVPAGYTQTKAEGSSKTDADGNVTVTYKFENTKRPEGVIATQVEVQAENKTVAGNADEPAKLDAVDAAKPVTVVDHISYSNLTKDATYVVSGSLYEVANGETVGEAIATASDELVADGTTAWTITFENVTIEPGKTYVVFEKAVNKEELAQKNNDEAQVVDKAKHEDANDSSQTVVVGDTYEVKINKTDLGGTEIAGAVIKVTDADDNVVQTWTSVVGKTMDITVKAGEYTLEETNAPAGYVPVTTKIVFEVAENGTVTVKTTEVEPKEAKCVLENGVIVLKDVAEETPETPAPDIKTTATDAADKDKNVVAEPKATVKDVVKYFNLNEGTEYTMKGELVNKKTEEVVATAEEKFTAGKDGNGEVTLTFTFDASKLAGEKAVAFEKAYEGETLIATHADLSDKDQTVDITKPDIKTTASDAEPEGEGEDKSIAVKEEAKIKDVVSYTNLTPGKKYTMEGQLVKKSDGSAIEGATASKEFTASKTGNGTVELTFTVDTTALKGEKLVAFETAKFEGAEVVVHADINDAAQTVEVENPKDAPKTPAIATTATDNADSDKKVVAEKNAQVKDVVEYKNLTAGKKYTMEGQLVKKADKSVITTATKEFTAAEGGSGTVELVFTFDASKLAGQSAVAFETAKEGDKVVATHADIDDADQTVEITEPKIATTATTDDGKKTVALDADKVTYVTIKDVVTYTNLTPGKTYTMEGKLVKKSDGSAIAGATASKAFVADKSGNGTVELTFTNVNADLLAGDACVAFEKAYKDGGVVATHEDIKDAAQTVEVTKKPEKPENPTVEISKTDATTSKELPGAKLIITKKGSDEVLYQHTSTTQTWKVKLAPGEYTLTEITAPKGYEVAESINFTVDEKGLVGSEKVHMEDAPTPEEPEPEITEVTVTKVWNDTNDQDGKRPKSIKVNLLRDGAQAATATLNTSNDWTHTWSNLPKKNDAGVEYTYTVVEANVPAGYEASVNGTIITNTHAPETVDITGTKTWNDSDNQDGKRPASITVNLLKNGDVIATDTVTEAEGWKYTFTELPKYENGEEITYSVEEEPVAEYTTTYGENEIINTYAPGTTGVTVKKVWNDSNNKDNIRPESVAVTLMKNGEISDTQVLSAANGWTHTWTGLPEMEDGQAVKYTVDESLVPEGYTKSVKVNGKVTTIVNKHVPETPQEEKKNPFVTISKTDATTSAELPGAALIIKNLAGETVLTFVSGSEPTKFQLEPGEYTLTEVTAPKGYEVAETISFTVDANGLVGSDKVEMKDAPIVEEENPTVTISKTDAATTAELPGATLIIRNAEGKIVESFVSGSEPTLVQLAPGEYTLTELTAPQGYQVAETISFTVDANGLVGSDKVEMKDAPIVEEEKEGKLATTVHANGTVASNAAAAQIDLQAKDGAVNVVDYIVYTDLKGGVTYAVTGQLMKIVDGKAVEVVAERTYDYTADASGNGEWVMVIGDVTVEQDTKYVVFETAVEKNVAEGETPETIEHKDANDTAQTVVVKPYVEGTEVEISKQDATTKEELPGAQLVVKNTAGDIVAEWTSGTTPHKITLKPGNYTLTEITAPDGYLKAETIAFTVDENGLVGSDKVVMLDAREDSQNIKNTTGADITAEKFWTTGWPEGVSVTFTLQYYDGGEWKTYYKEDGTTYTVTIAEGEVAVFENVPVQINGATAKYRVVEDAVDGYNVKEWKATDFDNFDGTMSVTNQPNGGKQETTPGESTDKEQTTNNESPSSETGKKTPQNNNDDNNNNDKDNNNGGDNNTGVTTPTPGRTTSGGYPRTPVTTRRTGTYATSTPSVSSSTATSTGDTNNAVLWIVLAAAASAAIAGAAVVMRRRRHED